ncbi:MAG: xylulokinase [Pseudohongiellaceae bacterium]
MSKFLGIDLGTQSLKAVIYDADGRKVTATGSSELQLNSEPDGTREQQADWWLAALHDAIGQLDAKERKAVAAIGVSGQQHGFVPLAADGSVLAPVKLWCDTATTTECEEIEAAFGGRQRCIAEVGNGIMPGYTASKIRWLKKHKPDAYQSMNTIMLPHDYLNYYLSGERFMECGDASGTGLLDIRSRTWHPGMLQALDADRDLSKCLPPLIDAGASGGQLLPAVAKKLGLTAGIPIACGGGDNMMAAIATGNMAAGRLTMSLGTSGTLFAYADSPCLDEVGELAAFCSSTGGWLPLLCTMNCTVATEQPRSLFQMEVQPFDDSVSAAPPGAEGIIVLPFYNGERTPNLPNGRGCIMGMNDSNMTRDNINRASMESAVYGLRLGLEAFRRSNCPIDEIRLTGGAARSAVWRQMIADNFKLPVRLLQADEGAALGAALNAMLLGSRNHGDSTALAAEVDEHIRFDDAATALPDKSLMPAYDKSYARYLAYLDLVRPMFARA